MRLIILLILMCLILLSIFLVASSEVVMDRTYTSAVCHGNKCVDYLFTCKDGQIIEFRPISSLVVFEETWVDLRQNKTRC